MRKHLQQNLLANLKHDLPASIVVFLVAVPLCLGIALASGAPLFSGIIAGIVGGILVGSLSGSQLGVSGPAAGLAVIVLSGIEKLGGFEVFLLAVVIGGMFQLLLGFARAGIIGYFFPSSVIKGMLSGIGLIIMLKQLPHAVGYDADPEGSLSFAQPDGHTTLSELWYVLDSISAGPLLITIVSLLILLAWEHPFIAQRRFSRIVQGPLVAVLAGIGMHLLFQNTETLALASGQLVSLPVPDGMSGFLGQFATPDFTQVFNPQVWIMGLTIAVVASLETLLCLDATDKMDPHKRVTPANRELAAQGVGNIAAGLIGGLPITQVIVRSSTNILSGGRTKLSAIMHGVLLLACAFAIPALLNLIPLASLAAILFTVGYKLAKPVLFRQMYRLGKHQFVPFIVTVVGIVFTDLLIGIGIGMSVAVFYVMYNNYRKPFLVRTDLDDADHTIRLELAEDVTFVNKASIQRTLSRLPANSHVIIDASRSVNIDSDVIEIIEDFRANAQYRGIRLELIDLQPTVLPDPHVEVQRALARCRIAVAPSAA
ncbi:MAG: SulP family inorganic anion transporter [Gammaproteobacteria bacterium]|nr:SulP family inorganic anion transporter [Gammaproteobacteria bacterium]